MRNVLLTLLLCFSWTLNANVSAEDIPPRRLILLPIAYYTPETSLAAGALAIINIKKVKEGRTSNIVTSASYTVKQQSIFILQPKFYFLDGQADISVGARYLFYPSEYYGRGNNVKNSDKQKFTMNTQSTDIFGRYFPFAHFFTGAGAGISRITNVDVHEGNVLQSEFASGFDEYEVRTLSFGIGWDRRDHQNAPLEGAYHQLTNTLSWAEDPAGKIRHRSFNRLELDLKHYFKVGDKKVLAWQYVIGKLDGALIPFGSLFKLGGGNHLRGYLANKYRDKALTLTQFEYRADFSEHFAYAVFAGAGVVAPDVPTLWENRKRLAGGAGIHYIADKENRQKFRFDVGIGEESEYGVYVVFGEAF